jgi:hypothetical protein
VRTISDLLAHAADLKAGFSIEFMNREDGWLGLSRFYGLQLGNVRAMEHSLAYEALAQGARPIRSRPGLFLGGRVVLLVDRVAPAVVVGPVDIAVPRNAAGLPQDFLGHRRLRASKREQSRNQSEHRPEAPSLKPFPGKGYNRIIENSTPVDTSLRHGGACPGHPRHTGESRYPGSHAPRSSPWIPACAVMTT